MLFRTLVLASVENILNAFLYRSSALKNARQKLSSKILRINLEKFPKTLVLIFSDRFLSVLSKWEGEADCSITIYTHMLSNICNYQQLITLVHSKKFEIKGELQVVHDFITLIDLAEFDLTELLVPYTGDVAAEIIKRVFCNGLFFLLNSIRHLQRYISDVIIEELCIAPGTLEVSWFKELISTIALAVEASEKWLEKLENK